MDLQESHAENYLEEPGHNGAGWERGRGGGRRAGRERAGGKWFCRCFVQGNEIFLIFRPPNSNLGTWMSPKARYEPGWRIAGGCVQFTLFYRNI